MPGTINERQRLTCVDYKNGARHTLPDYADMALRTANKRAYLQGEGAKRQEWGIHTVIVNKRLKACPHCMPFAGKVFIDDVWGGGTKEDGNYPLLSTAIEAGLYHPRCRDSHTAYFPGITDRPGKYTKAEVKDAERAEEKEEKENYARRQAEKYQRLADTRMDQENRLVDQHKANRWKEEAAPFNPAKTIEEAQEYAEKFCQTSFMDKTFKGKVNFKGISLEHANAINRSLTDAYNRFPDMEKLSGIKTVAPGSAQGKKAFKSGADALFSYSPVEHGIFINKDVLKNPKTLDAYMQRSQDAWDLVMNNIDKLSGKNRKLAEIYSNAGRELVTGDTVEGLFTHELGHHVQWTMLDPKTTNSLTSRMRDFAPHISGYANTSNSEYLAESFAAYMKGETGILDQEYVEYLDINTRIDMTTVVEDSIIKTAEQVSSKELHSLENVVVLKEKVAKGEITLNLNLNKQLPHMESSRANGASYLTISLTDLQNLVNQKYGTGNVILNRAGQIKEIIELEYDVGMIIDPLNQDARGIPTNRITIHYSKKANTCSSGKEVGMSELNLSQFLFKNVKVKLTSGTEYTGVVVGYWSAEENEGEESIGISESRFSHNGLEFSKTEINSIEIIG